MKVSKSTLFLFTCTQILGFGFKLTQTVSGKHIRHQHHRQSESHLSDHNTDNRHNYHVQNISDSVNTRDTREGINLSNKTIVNKFNSSNNSVATNSEYIHREQLSTEQPFLLERGQMRGLDSADPSQNHSQFVARKKNFPTFLTAFHNLLVSSSQASSFPQTPATQFESTDKDQDESSNRKKPFQTLTRAWFPSSLTYGEMGNFVIRFTTNSTHRDQLQHFLGAQIIFTLKNNTFEADNTDNSSIKFVSSSHSYRRNNTALSLPLGVQNKFYCFDVAEEVRRRVDFNSSASRTDAEDITFTFKIRKNVEHFENHVSFVDYFDDGNDKPFILIRYPNVPMIVVPQALYDDKRYLSPTSQAGVQRRKRSALSRKDSDASSNLVSLTTLNSPNEKDYLSITDAEFSETTPTWTGTGKNENVDNYSVRVSQQLDRKLSNNYNEAEKRNSMRILQDLASKNEEVIITSSTSKSKTLGARQNVHTKKEKLVKAAVLPTTKFTSATGGNDKFCRRQKWLTKPTEVGWDNAQFPDLIMDLGYCAGSCPYPLVNERFNFSTHSYLMDQLRLLKPIMELPKDFPSPCCVPVSYKALMILTNDGDGGIGTILYPDITVTSCGCR